MHPNTEVRSKIDSKEDSQITTGINRGLPNGLTNYFECKHVAMPEMLTKPQRESKSDDFTAGAKVTPVHAIPL